MWSLLPLLWACGQPAHEVRYVLEPDVGRLPDRAGDPIGLRSVTLERTVDGEAAPLCDVEDSPYGCRVELDWPEPQVLGPAGAPAEVEALTDAEGAVFAWTVVEGAGTFQIVGVAELPGVPLSEPVSFELLDWGSADPFDPVALEGTAWALREYHLMPLDIAAASDLHPDLLVALSDVDSEGADVRVVAEAPAGDCVALSVRATWQGSELSWGEEVLSLDHPDLGTLTAEDMAFSIAWRSERDDRADARARARIDTGPLSALLVSEGQSWEPDDLCQDIESFGGDCVPCEQVDSPWCINIRAYDGVLERLEDPFPEDLPLCGMKVDPVGIPTFDCQIELSDCSCSTGASRSTWPLLLVLALVRRRRTSR